MNKTLIKIFVFIVFVILFLQLPIYGQTNVSITIDDVPNTKKFSQDNYQSILLKKLDSLEIPIAIFINEGLIYKTDSINKNFKLLNDWIKRDYITVGNHTFSHLRYSEVGFDSFKINIEKGESITRSLAKKYTKPLQYFRFPYNDLGKDSIQYKKIDSLLQLKKYIITPYTIECSDWMFNYIYEYYLKKYDFKEASKIGELYVKKTLDYFIFFGTLSTNLYGRKINQIYLCHDNSINAVYLSKIINHLKEQNYNFVSLDKVLKDIVYQQKYKYYKKWGTSWFYRWMPLQDDRIKLMKKEPDIDSVYKLYTQLTKKSNK